MTYDQIVIFPDFDLAGRTMDNICYWDNIWGEEAIECEAEAAVPIDYLNCSYFTTCDIIRDNYTSNYDLPSKYHQNICFIKT